MYLMEEVIKYLKSISLEELINIVESSLDHTFALETMVAYPNDYMTFQELFADTFDAVRATFYGNYNLRDEFIVINAMGNIDSFDRLDLIAFYNSNMEEIADIVMEYDLLTE